MVTFPPNNGLPRYVRMPLSVGPRPKPFYMLNRGFQSSIRSFYYLITPVMAYHGIYDLYNIVGSKFPKSSALIENRAYALCCADFPFHLRSLPFPSSLIKTLNYSPASLPYIYCRGAMPAVVRKYRNLLYSIIRLSSAAVQREFSSVLLSNPIERIKDYCFCVVIHCPV